MYRYLLQNKIHIALYLIFAPLSAVCSLAVSAGMAAAIDYANGGNLSDIWKYLIVFDVYILLDLATDQIFKSVRFRLVKRTMVNLRLDLYRSISRMEPRRFALKNTADFISALTSDTEILRDSYFSVLFGILYRPAALFACNSSAFLAQPDPWNFCLYGNFGSADFGSDPLFQKA